MPPCVVHSAAYGVYKVHREGGIVCVYLLHALQVYYSVLRTTKLPR